MTTGPAARDIGDLHAVLAGWLAHREGCSPAEVVQRHGTDAVLAACEREGVVSLLHARLAEIAVSQPVPADLLQALAARARMCAARSLLCVSEARRIQQALDAAGIPAIWLKGIALGQWLYPRAHLRDIADIDLLLPDHATTLRAAEVLEPLGYTLPNPHIAGDLVVHELLAWSERAQLELDLHWDLSNGALFAGRLPWARLWEASNPVPGLGTDARGLSPVEAFLHACMHRAANALTGQEDRLRWLYDIHLLWEEMSPELQARAVWMAADSRLADVAHAALRSSQATFATDVDASVLAVLAAHAENERVRSDRLGSWLYLQVATLRVLPPSDRARWLRQLLFPDFNHLRRRYVADGAGRFRVLVRRLHDGLLRWRGYMRS